MNLNYFLKQLPLVLSIRRQLFYRFNETFSILLFIIFLILVSFINSTKVLAQTTSTTVSFVSTTGNNTTPLIVGIRGGKTVQARIGVNNLQDPDGLAAYSFKLGYDSSLATIADTDNNFIADTGAVNIGSFLGSSGKQTLCSNGYIDPDQTNPVKKWLTFSCVTQGPTPAGPTGSGILATINFKTTSKLGYSPLELTATELVDNTQNVNLIPHTAIYAGLRVARCADFTGSGGLPDGIVRIPDINAVVANYGSRTNLQYDLDENGIVLVPDISIAVAQYGMTC